VNCLALIPVTILYEKILRRKSHDDLTLVIIAYKERRKLWLAGYDDFSSQNYDDLGSNHRKFLGF
jgi:hypothetical protein